MPVIDRDGVSIHHDVVGAGDVIVATHGFGSSAHVWTPAATALAATHRVVTWDVRGHGRTGDPADPNAYSVPLAVGDMIALLDSLGAERAVLMGHSMGGYLSLEMQRTHPDRVAALVLVGTGPGFRNDGARERWNSFAERIAVRLEHDGLTALGTSDEVRADVHRGAAGLVLAARGMLPQTDGRVIDGLADVAVPALVVVGEHDTRFLDSSRYLADRIPQAELVVVDDAGHAPMVSQPDAFVQCVTTFLAGVRT